MMNGIDISHWQKGLDLSKIKCDFVIVKATEGVQYLDPCFHDFMRQAEALGKCMGFYHFARPELNDAKTEAKFFYANTTKYFNKAIPILDWESAGKANVAWAKEWLDEIYSLTGVRPVLYSSESVINQYDWSMVANSNYGLWVAKYRDREIDLNYDMTCAGKNPVVKWWKFYCMWQWTSKGRLDGYAKDLDCDVFYGSREAWGKYAGAGKTYVVQEGDTLSSIAQAVGISVDELAEKNKLITVGQVLRF